MKKIIFIFIITSISTMQLFAQRNNNERIKVFKITFITNELDLNSNEAEKFWPVYNEYSKTIQKVKNKKTKELDKKIYDKGGIDKLSDIEAKQMLDDYIVIETNVITAKKVLRKKLTGIISPQKIVKLFNAEKDFNKELLKRFRQRRGGINKNN